MPLELSPSSYALFELREIYWGRNSIEISNLFSSSYALLISPRVIHETKKKMVSLFYLFFGFAYDSKANKDGALHIVSWRGMIQVRKKLLPSASGKG